MKNFFADLHIHVGMSEQGQWVKIPTSRRLTIHNILAEAAERKGLALIGVIDALSPLVLNDLSDLVNRGLLTLCSGGGYRYLDKITLLLGAEIETVEARGGQSHTLIFLPDIAEMTRFSQRMANHIRNINLSSQNAHIPLGRLIEIAGEHDAVIIPAHVFTPHKSLFGVCCHRLDSILTDRQIARIGAIELGLSADSVMADRIPELAQFSFLSNSDAHSLDKIAREYNVLMMAAPSFTEFAKVCRRQEGRRVAANYGLDPRLGKYHRSCCPSCGTAVAATVLPGQCSVCGGNQLIQGVFDRIEQIASYRLPQHPGHRSPYIYQIPLEFIPGIGKRAMAKLLADFGTEMNVLNKAGYAELVSSVGERLAGCIAETRSGQARIVNGGGGVYGRVKRH
ncbi:TIGR00375 family protein|uniref:TIGR00375 family protein n=1 Tax=Dendrosporobacter quercicolus TaxID=146817 RepID=A0A1G9KZC8_9FIRM|nr:endonuclease Q family protein [Dendrosporobacter quercicolus]NSL46545.1 TIGR00375 family protein [Dendrosporobacter quercicolus DSM 1736]SDL55220.1 TIGR00375 family protein [Dendrosporobacter quercicolus]